MTYTIDRLTNFVRGGTRLAVTFSKYSDDGQLLAQNHSINITLTEDDTEIQAHIDAINAFALSKLEVQNG